MFIDTLVFLKLYLNLFHYDYKLNRKIKPVILKIIKEDNFQLLTKKDLLKYGLSEKDISNIITWINYCNF